MIKLSSIKANPNNPRVIKDNKFKKLVKSIKDFPKMMELRPMVINSDNIVLGGNMRLKALKELGYKEVPKEWIKSADDLTEDEQRQFIIKDNIGFGEHDWEMLQSDWDLSELEEWGLDIPEWEEEEVLEAKEDDFDTTPPEEPKTVLGDLYEIGEHRLLCADSTDSDQVARLMNGEKADMVFTDPPYNVAFNGRSGSFDVIENDDLPEEDFEELIDGFVSVLNILNPENYYVWCNWKFYGLLQSKLEFKACIVWAKNVFGLGRGYRHQHEFCLFNGKLDEGRNSESDLWEISKDSNYQHPTQKPVALSVKALQNHKKAKTIVDLFAGSGSTMLGVHQSKRKCFAMELDPKYCDVIVKRMMALDSNLKIKLNGKEIEHSYFE